MSKYHNFKLILFFRAYETLGNPQKRKVYDSTGMNSNDQQNTDFQFDGSSFSDLFNAAFRQAEAEQESMANKTYEQILEEYEKFFSMDEEVERGTKTSMSGRTTGSECKINMSINFAESLEGTYRKLEYDRLV